MEFSLRFAARETGWAVLEWEVHCTAAGNSKTAKNFCPQLAATTTGIPKSKNSTYWVGHFLYIFQAGFKLVPSCQKQRRNFSFVSNSAWSSKNTHEGLNRATSRIEINKSTCWLLVSVFIILSKIDNKIRTYQLSHFLSGLWSCKLLTCFASTNTHQMWHISGKGFSGRQELSY